MGDLFGLLVGATLIALGFALFTDHRGVTYRMSRLGLRLQGYKTVPERLVPAVRYKTRVGRAVGLFLIAMGTGGVVTVVVRALAGP